MDATQDLSPIDSSRIYRLQQLVAKYEAAIRKHRDQRGDDRCYLDDAELYSVLPEGDTRPPGDSAVTLENCAKFIASRCDPRLQYLSPQRRIEELETELANIKKAKVVDQATMQFRVG